ncbi:hypothetical protein EBT25_04035 [bacterium]|nr:hypothetical protein [bacterium]
MDEKYKFLRMCYFNVQYISHVIDEDTAIEYFDDICSYLDAHYREIMPKINHVNEFDFVRRMFYEACKALNLYDVCKHAE